MICSFSHDPEPNNQISEQEDCPPPKRRAPSLILMNMKYQIESSEILTDFSTAYHDLHYNMAQDPATNDSFYLYNPETILKISLPSPEDRIESLYIR